LADGRAQQLAIFWAEAENVTLSSAVPSVSNFLVNM